MPDISTISLENVLTASSPNLPTNAPLLLVPSSYLIATVLVVKANEPKRLEWLAY